jgi:toxin FitB
MAHRNWSPQDAENRFSAVVDAAPAGEPQLVTRRGKRAVVVLAADEFERLSRLDRAHSRSRMTTASSSARPCGRGTLSSDVPARHGRALVPPAAGRHPRAAAWIGTRRDSELHVSVVTTGEIERGIERQRAREPQFAATLAAWLDRVLALYGERVLPFTLGASLRRGRLSAVLGNDSADLMIAATALEHGLTVVTRNTRHFEPTGVRVLDRSA